MSIKQPRTAQHKPTRDDRKTKEVQDLKAENRALRKQIARYRKEAQRPEIVIREEVGIAVVNQDMPKCSACDSTNVKGMTTPGGTVLIVCKACGSRTSKVNK